MKTHIKLIIFILLIIPIKANATNINLNCPEKTSPGSTITCEISLTSDTKINAVAIKYKLPEEITYTKLETKENWESHYNQKDGLVTTKSNNTQTENKIADLNLTISKENTLNKEYQISLTDIDISDINYNSKSLSNITTTIKIISDDNSLSNLTITNGTLNPAFDKNKTNYTATVTKDNTTITAISTDKNAKVSGDIGNKKLNYGANHFIITVTSPLGTNKQYKITITRPSPKPTTNENNKPNTNTPQTNNIVKNNDASLKELIIKNQKLDLKKDKYIYNLTVPNEITNLEVTATPTNSKSTVKIENNNNLKIGENIITITVAAEDGTICKYIINVVRQEKLSNDNTIKELIIENYELDFNPTKLNYNLTIEGEASLKIKVKLNHEKASYKITGNKNLKNNSNIIITTTAEDKTTKKYTIKITKQDNENSKIISSKTIIIIITILISVTGILTTKAFNKNNENN